MFDFISRLQQKSPQTRQRITLGVATSITALVSLIWVSTFLSSSTQSMNQTLAESQDQKQQQAASPLAALQDTISRVFSQAQSRVEAQFSGLDPATSTKARATSAKSTQEDEPEIRIIRGGSSSSGTSTDVTQSSTSSRTR